MKKVLIISFFFPPSTEIGSRRPFGLAKYLPEYGWYPVVLTTRNPGNSPNNIEVIESDYKDVISNLKAKVGLDPVMGLHDQMGIRVSKKHEYSTIKSKSIKFLKEVITFPDVKKGWYKFAFESASKLLDSDKVDIIISTSPPEISHFIARKLSEKYKIPWIADLRDPWTQDPNYGKSNFIKYFDKRVELKTLSSADALVTVTEPWADSLKTLYKNKKIYCITNGFDEDDYPKIPFNLTDKFTLTYTGLLYNGNRDPSLLFNVVAQLIKENKINKYLVEIRFYTPLEDWLIEEIKEHNLEGVVNVYGLIPREEVLNKQRESQVLLLLLSEKESESGLCPAKLYEYMGVMRPVIALGGHGGVAKSILNKTRAGKFSENREELKQDILEYYNEYLNHKKVVCSSNSNVNNYNYRFTTGKYSKILNSLMLKLS